MSTFYRVTGTHRGIPHIAHINHLGQIKTTKMEDFEVARIQAPANCFVPQHLQQGLWENLEVAILVCAQLPKLFNLAGCKVEAVQC